MNTLFKLPTFTLLTFFVSGCYLPGTESLILSSASYFIKAQLLEDLVETNQPITVADLLAQAKGEGIVEEPVKAPKADTHSPNPVPKKMSVSELLNNARNEKSHSPGIDTKFQKNEYSITLTNEDTDGEVLTRLDKTFKSQFKPHSQFQVYLGSKTDTQDMSPFFGMFLKMRNFCAEQSNYCSPTNLNIDPNLSVGKVLFVPEQGGSNA